MATSLVLFFSCNFFQAAVTLLLTLRNHYVIFGLHRHASAITSYISAAPRPHASQLSTRRSGSFPSTRMRGFHPCRAGPLPRPTKDCCSCHSPQW